MRTRACKAIYGIVETGFEPSRVIGRRAKRGAGCGSKVQVLEVSNGELAHGQADRRTRLGKGGVLRG